MATTSNRPKKKLAYLGGFLKITNQGTGKTECAINLTGKHLRRHPQDPKEAILVSDVSDGDQGVAIYLKDCYGSADQRFTAPDALIDHIISLIR